MQLPLEDEATDVLCKAITGRHLTPASVASQCGLTIDDVESAIDDPDQSAHTAAIATFLGLDPTRLLRIARGEYRPAAVELDGLAQFNTEFDDMTVNAYLVWDPASGEAAAFDTGGDCEEMLEFAETRKLEIRSVFITHSHGDHIFDLDRLIEKTGATAHTPEKEEVDGVATFLPGAEFQIGALSVASRLTWGHSKGGVTYVISGLAAPVAVCGDAIFSGSMGGGRESYADALRTNREQIFTLSDETILCPGHGPMTTVGSERQNNPFFP